MHSLAEQRKQHLPEFCLVCDAQTIGLLTAYYTCIQNLSSTKMMRSQAESQQLPYMNSAP